MLGAECLHRFDGLWQAGRGLRKLARRSCLVVGAARLGVEVQGCKMFQAAPKVHYCMSLPTSRHHQAEFAMD